MDPFALNSPPPRERKLLTAETLVWLEAPMSDAETRLNDKVNNTWGLADAVMDFPYAYARGSGVLAELVGTAIGLPFDAVDNPLTRAGRSAREYWSEGMSEELKTAKQELQTVTDAAEGVPAQFGAAVKYLVTNPALLLTEAATQVPMFIPGGVAGGVVGKTVGKALVGRVAGAGLPTTAKALAVATPIQRAAAEKAMKAAGLVLGAA